MQPRLRADSSWSGGNPQTRGRQSRAASSPRLKAREPPNRSIVREPLNRSRGDRRTAIHTHIERASVVVPLSAISHAEVKAGNAGRRDERLNAARSLPVKPSPMKKICCRSGESVAKLMPTIVPRPRPLIPKFSRPGAGLPVGRPGPRNTPTSASIGIL